MTNLVRYGISKSGSIEASTRGGRGAWACRTAEDGHDRNLSEGLQRGLRRRLPAESFVEILADRKREAQERG